VPVDTALTITLFASKLTSQRIAKSSPGYFKDIQTRIRKFIESGQLGPFKNGYWDNPAYKCSPEADFSTARQEANA
jgi:Ni,Fe-hydrogenase I large subunit